MTYYKMYPSSKSQSGPSQVWAVPIVVVNQDSVRNQMSFL